MELRYPAEQFALFNHRDVVRGPMTRVSFKTPVGDASMTVQDQADACDIHNILRRYQMTGDITHLNSFEGRYDDFRDFPESYQEALNTVLDAEASFSQMPASVRDAYANDPATFFRAVHDPDQQERLIQLGVFTKREEPPQKPADAPKGASEGVPPPKAD